jgi:hypothetical protein
MERRREEPQHNASYLIGVEQDVMIFFVPMHRNIYELSLHHLSGRST